MKKLLMIALLIALIASCTGCDSPSDTKEAVNIAFVSGIADDETKFDPEIEELVSLSEQPGSDYAFISVEGDPVCIGEPDTVADLSDRNYTDTMINRIREGMQAEFDDTLNSYTPASSEIDMAEALQLAVRQLNAHADDQRPNVLVLYCSGRSTSGLINMVQTPLYRIDIDRSVAAIAAEMDLDLSSIDQVIWYCCGECGGDQPPLSANEKSKLKTFYQRLFITLGMDESQIVFKDGLPLSESYHFAEASVTPIETQGDTSALHELSEEVLAENAFADPIVIPETQVRYQPDSADFLDPQAAAAAIDPVAQYLLKYPDLNILLYATCAGDSDSEDTVKLSTDRAQRVKDLLVEKGIESQRITVISVKASDDPYYQFGLGTGEAASVNRKTVMMDRNSALAMQLLSEER